ncbi:unnamed protein product, partial [Didymodactylos carnosus]
MLAVVFPTQKMLHDSTIGLIILVFLQWLCAFLIPLPALYSTVLICIGYVVSMFLPLYEFIDLLVVSMVFVAFSIGLIVFCVRKSTSKVQPVQQQQQQQQQNHHASSVQFMKYVVVMYIIFVFLGYGPIGLLTAIDYVQQVSSRTYIGLGLLPPVCLFIDIIILYIYNQDLRRYLMSIVK